MSRKVTSKTISPYQHEFILGHQVFDASLIANEFVNSYLKSKLDIKKAFDHVS